MPTANVLTFDPNRPRATAPTPEPPPPSTLAPDALRTFEWLQQHQPTFLAVLVAAGQRRQAVVEGGTL